MLTTSNLDEPGPQIIYVNPAFSRLTGYQRQELVGQTPRILQGEETSRETLRRLREALGRGDPFEDEAVNYRKDGTPFIMRWYVEALRNRKGEITHYYGLLRDVTEEREAERVSHLMQSAIERLSDSVVIFDHQGEVSYANPAYQSWSGWSLRRILSTSVWDLPGRPARHQELRWARSLLSLGRPWQRDYEVRRRAPERQRRFAFTTISPIQWSDGEATTFVAMGRDVTERHRLEAIAESHNFHDNLGMVFSGIRHELGNPVNSLKSALRVVRDSLPEMEPERLSGYLRRIDQEVGRIEYLLRSMRSYNMFQRPTLENLDAHTFLHRLVALLREYLEGRRIELKLDFEEDVDTLHGDPQGLHQVLLNLVKNASEAMAEQPEPRITLTARRAGPRVELIVSDNGHGIPAEQIELVFQPFYTNRDKGTGLGLAITRRLVSQMRGTVDLVSSPRGTDVTVTLDRRVMEDPQRDG